MIIDTYTQVLYPVQANAVFARLPVEVIPALQRAFFFYPWNATRGEVRWMTSFDTEAADIEDFATLIENVLPERNAS